MSVRYDIVLGNNKKLCRSDICFGAMNSLPWSSSMVTPGFASNTDESPTICANMTTADMKMLQYIPGPNMRMAYWSHPEGKPTRDTVHTQEERSMSAVERQESVRNRALKNYFREMKLIIDDMPMFKDCVTVHPLLKLTRTHIKDFAADKVILSMFLMRNLAQYDYVHCYLMLRDLGYRPRVAAIFSQLFQYQKSAGIGSDTVTGRSNGESSFIYCNWFGEEAAIRLLRQGEDVNDLWIQDPWIEQSCGYKRDGHLASDRNTFIPASSGRMAVMRTLNMATCIPGDKMMDWGGPKTSTSETGRNFNYYENHGVTGLIQLIDSLCEKAGIEGKLND